MPFFFTLGKKVHRKIEKPSNPKSLSNKISTQKTASTNVENNSTVRQTSPRVAGFKDKTAYEILLEWDLSQIKKPFKYQRIGINSWTTMDEAIKDISWFVRIMNNVSCDKATVSKIQVVRIVGIYEKHAFKDWSTDPYNSFDSKVMKKHIAEAIEFSKKANKTTKKKPISYLKEDRMQVRK